MNCGRTCFDPTLAKAKAEARLGDLAATLARGRTRRAPENVRVEVSAITEDPWVTRVTTTDLTGDTPGPPPGLPHRRQGPPSPGDADIVADYRSQSDVEFSFR
jgi:hypothetical protein